MIPGNKKVQFTIAVRRGLNTPSFYSVDEFFLCLRMIHNAVYAIF